MTIDGFEATFRLRIDRAAAWRRLTSQPLEGEGERLWLPGFDSAASIVEADPPERLRATKDEEPCAGTDIVITLTDEDTGTRIHVVQSRFGDRLPASREMMAIGWRFIVADLHTFLATGVHAHRHLRAWRDLGANATADVGALLIHQVRPDSLAHQLGMTDGDLLVAFAGAPIASLDDLVTALRIINPDSHPTAEWIRAGTLQRSTSPNPN